MKFNKTTTKNITGLYMGPAIIKSKYLQIFQKHSGDAKRIIPDRGS